MATKPTRKTFGRSLSDFPKLSKVERDLIEHCRIGKLLVIGDGTRPEKPTIKNKIRSGLIRFLLLGGDAQNPVHENGVQIAGAWIEGDWIISSCICQAQLIIRNSTLNGQLHMQDCTLPLLNLRGSSVQSIRADRAVIKGSVFLDVGFKATGTVRLLGAQIGGNLACRNATFEPNEGDALSADRAVIKGNVFLNDGFKATGTVRLLGAQIGGELSCRNATFEPKEGNAFSADRAVIKGDVFLDDGFKATATVRLPGAQIGGNLSCRNATFEPKEGDALGADRAVIKGSVFLDDGFKATGPIRFSNVQIGSLIDNPDLPKEIILDGLTYNSFAGGASTDAATRIAWLNMQPRSHLYEDFRPQPWEQLIKVLRSMGHKADADIVAIAKQDQLYKAGKITGLNILWHKLYGWLAGYGYRPSYTLFWMIMVWYVAAWQFDFASSKGLIGPTSAIIQTNTEIANACNVANNSQETIWTSCAAMPQTYTTFSPFFYSLDLILPLVDLQQENDWSPIVMKPNSKTIIWDGVWFRALMWFEILFGWMASLLLVAVLSNLVKKD